MHLGFGAPKIHTEEQHNTSLNRDLMVNNTKIIRREDDTRRLKIYEALLIQQKRPTINNQETGYTQTLKLYSNGPHDQLTRQQPLPSSSNLPATTASNLPPSRTSPHHPSFRSFRFRFFVVFRLGVFVVK